MMLDFFNRSSIRDLARRLAGEVFWIGFGQFLSAAGALVGVRVLTGVLSPSAYGEVALGITAAGFVQQLLTSPIGESTVRFYAPAKESRDLAGYFLGLKRVAAIMSVVVLGLGFVVCSGLAATRFSGFSGLTAVAFLLSLFTGWNTMLDGVQAAARRRKLVAMHQGAGQWLRFLIAAGLCGVVGSTSTAAVAGYMVATLLVAGSQLTFVHRELQREEDFSNTPAPDAARAWSSRMWNYALPFAGWGLFTWMQAASDRWALQTFATPADVGRYAVLYQLGYYPVNMLSGVLIQFVSPVIFGRAGDGTDQARMGETTRLSLLLTAVMIGCTALGVGIAVLAHRPLFEILVKNPEYRSVSPLLPWMVLAGGLFAASQASTLRALIEIRPGDLLVPKIATATVGTLLTCLGAMRFGVRGVVWAAAVFSALYLTWMLIVNYGNGPSRPQ